MFLPLAHWTTAQRLRDARPSEVIKDERVPEILRALGRPTFVTIDLGFWNKRLRDAQYCILCFPLENDQQDQLPALLRRLFRLPEFRSRAARMGKVARVSSVDVAYWQLGTERLHRLEWAHIKVRGVGRLKPQQHERQVALRRLNQPTQVGFA